MTYRYLEECGFNWALAEEDGSELQEIKEITRYAKYLEKQKLTK